MPSQPFSERQHLLLWGATGFTGELTAAYLAEHAGPDVRWALGGRSEAKLQQVRDRLAKNFPAAAKLPLVVGDAADSAFLAATVGHYRCVCTTVGPYGKYGSPLVAACAAAGTNYCDLTGEVHWMAAMLRQHQDTALQTGARIVPTCGFDSIPSDLGAFLAVEQFAAAHNCLPESVTTYVRAMKGGFSGGTVASQLSISEMSADPAVAAAWRQPFSLVPADTREWPRARDIFPVKADDDENAVTCTFLMAPCNGKVVRRSLWLQHRELGHHAHYEEKMAFPRTAQGWLMAYAYSAGLAAMNGSLGVTWFRNAVTPLLPKPGDGPSEEERNAGHFRFEIVARAGHKTARVTVRGDKDPGYGATAGMLGESALCLALDGDQLPRRAGFLTPATAMGHALLQRLPRAGVTFEAG